MSILLIVLVLMNTYPLLVSEDLVFRAKHTALQASASAINTAVAGLEELTEENVAQAMEAVEIDGVSRAVVTDENGLALYDTREVGSAAGYYVFYTELVQSLRGYSAVYSVYEEGAFRSSAAQPVLYRNQIIGAVYVYDYDTQQASLLKDLQNNLMRISVGIAILVVCVSLAFSRGLTRRLDSLLTAIRGVREGAYNQRAVLSGHDEYTQIAGEFNDLVDRLQETENARRRFVSDASHELRTPIAVLKGYADLLERWGKDDPQVRDEAIAAIQTEAGRMSRLVEQLLFLARGDSGRTKLNPASLDLTDLTREVFEESKMIDPDHVWLLEAAEPISYTADRDMLKQAMRILADNAAKYTPTGGEIQLRAARSEEGEVRIAVQDTGMGIRAEDAPHVFQRFYRADPARSRQSGGAGLGLSIASWILSQHGGFLEVYSWEGVGSRFTMVLPKEDV